MSDMRVTSRRPVRIGFRTSIITVFVAAVLIVGLTLATGWRICWTGSAR